MKHSLSLILLLFLPGCPDSKQISQKPTNSQSTQPVLQQSTPSQPQPVENPLDSHADLGIPKDAKTTASHASGTASGSETSARTDNNYVPSHFDSPRYTKENWQTWEYRKGNSVKSLRRKYENGKWLYRLEVNNTSPPTITYFEAEDSEAAEKNF